MYGRGEVKPEIMRTYPLEQIHQAMEVIVGRQVKGKIVLTTAAA